MSKSRGNVVSPDRYVPSHGSDVLRCALLFTCPWESGGDFHDETIAGIERFFTRVWNGVIDTAALAEAPSDDEAAIEGRDRLPSRARSSGCVSTSPSPG